MHWHVFFMAIFAGHSMCQNRHKNPPAFLDFYDPAHEVPKPECNASDNFVYSVM